MAQFGNTAIFSLPQEQDRSVAEIHNVVDC